MTLPEGVQPSGPTEALVEPASEPTTEAPVEPVPEPETDPAPSETVDDAASAEEETPEEVASDAALRAWARDNGMEDVPSSGRLSAVWRDQITAAMAAALDPKDEASVEAEDSSASSTSEMVTTETETTPEEPGGDGPSASTEPVPVQPERDNPTGEYRSVFYAPNTFVTGQAYTA